jgi:pimeloyl-ACP methyl ester carboxylesterase
LAAARLATATSPVYWRAAASEMGNIEVSNSELRAARRSFGAMPMVVLSRGTSPYAIPGKPQSVLNKAMEQANLAVHQELAALSSKGVHRIVPGAGHIIQHDKPGAVVQAVEEALDMLQR